MKRFLNPLSFEGCLGTPVVRTDAAGIWATDKTWWKVPLITKGNWLFESIFSSLVALEGKLRTGVTGKDIIITLCGLFADDNVLNHAVEFVGDGNSFYFCDSLIAGALSLSIDDRLTIANMTTEWGAIAGKFILQEL